MPQTSHRLPQRLFRFYLSVSLLLSPLPAWGGAALPCHLALLVEQITACETPEELDLVGTLRKMGRHLERLPNPERLPFVLAVFDRLQDFEIGWTYRARDYQGGKLFLGPTGNLRWLRSDGALLRSYLPADYWDTHDEENLNEPNALILAELPWEVLTPPSP